MVDKKLLEIREQLKAKKPRFLRQKAGHKKEVGMKYRKPRGYQSKLRLGKKGRGVLPSPGYRSPKEVRNADQNGLFEVVVSSIDDLNTIDAKTQIAVIKSTVGLRKRIELLKKADELKVKVSNAQDISSLEKSFKELQKTRKDKNIKRAEKAEEQKKKSEKKDKKKDTKKTTSSEKKTEDQKETSDKKEEPKKDDGADTEKKKQEKILIDKNKAM